MKKKKKKIKTMDLIISIIGIFLLVFVVCMVVLFIKYGSVPDTLITCVFAALGGECGILGWIKTNKDKLQDRQWMLQDEKRLNKQKGDDTYECY